MRREIDVDVLINSIFCIWMVFPKFIVYSFPFPKSIKIISPLLVEIITISFPLGVLHHKQLLTFAFLFLACLSIRVISVTFVRIEFF